MEWWKTRADLGRPAAAATTGRRARKRGRRIYGHDRERLRYWKLRLGANAHESLSERNGKINGIESLKIGHESGIKYVILSHLSTLYGGKLCDIEAISQHM